MTARHPLVTKWAADNARGIELFRRDRGPYVHGFNTLDHRKHRILSEIFFAVEKHGVVPGSLGYPEFHFTYQETMIMASLEPVDRLARSSAAKLRFVVLDPNPNVSIAYAEWSDGDIRLEACIPRIANVILVAARSAARARQKHLKLQLDAELLRVLDGLKELDALHVGSFAARCDPRTFEALLETAERHRKAVLVRHFLRSLSRTIADGSVEVTGRRLDDWVEWANAKTDEFDPLTEGAEVVFRKIAMS